MGQTCLEGQHAENRAAGRDVGTRARLVLILLGSVCVITLRPWCLPWDRDCEAHARKDLARSSQLSQGFLARGCVPGTQRSDTQATVSLRCSNGERMSTPTSRTQTRTYVLLPGGSKAGSETRRTLWRKWRLHECWVGFEGLVARAKCKWTLSRALSRLQGAFLSTQMCTLRLPGSLSLPKPPDPISLPALLKKKKKNAERTGPNLCDKKFSTRLF